MCVCVCHPFINRSISWRRNKKSNAFNAFLSRSKCNYMHLLFWMEKGKKERESSRDISRGGEIDLHARTSHIAWHLAFYRWVVKQVVRVSVRARVFVFEEKTCFLFFFRSSLRGFRRRRRRWLHFVFCSSRKEQKKPLLTLYYCLSLALRRRSSKSSELFLNLTISKKKE